MTREHSPGMEAPDWSTRAACREMPSELFFPDPGYDTDAAKQVCSWCPVTAQCLEAGIDERWGVWGGTSVTERRRLWRQTGTLCPHCYEPFINLERHIASRHGRAA